MFQPTWISLTSTPPLMRISVSPGLTAIWALTGETGDNVYYYVPSSNTWQRAPGAHLTSIAAVADGTVWGANGLSPEPPNIWLYSDGQWVQPVDGYLTSIAVGLDGEMWGVNAEQPTTDASNIYRYVGGSPDWLPIPGYLTDIAVGSDGVVWGVNTNLPAPYDVFRYTGALGAAWEPIETGSQTYLAQIAVGADNTVWGVNGSALWVYVEGSGFEQVEGDAAWVSASDANSVWRLDPQGAVSVTSFPNVTLALSLGDVVVLEENYVVPPVEDAIAPGAPRPRGVRTQLRLAEQRWHDTAVEEDQRVARSARAEVPAFRGSVVDVTSGEVLEVAKFVWEILKEGRPTWSTGRAAQSSILNPSASDWTQYVHATPGSSPVVTVKWLNGFNAVIATVRMRLAGTYHAAAASAEVTPGYYIPDLHFHFEEVRVSWGFSVNGQAEISLVSNLGGTTSADPINPSVSLSAVLQVSSPLSTVSKTFYFTATGKDGFVTSSREMPSD